MTVSVTVGMVTRDSHTRLGDSFADVLEAINDEVGYSAFVVADASSDDTVAVINRTVRNPTIIRKAGNRASSRQAVIDGLRTEWLLFVDDDCELRSGYMRGAEQHASDPKVGLIWGPGDTVTADSFRLRGGTHDTLIRQRAVRGIKIPSFLQYYEDAYIKKYVESQGFISAINTVGFVHLRELWAKDLTAEDAIERFQCAKFVGVYQPSITKAVRTAMVGVERFLTNGDKFRTVMNRLTWVRYYCNLLQYSPPKV
jgi:glycosyltransferase involved in cell wall biosynthesis